MTARDDALAEFERQPAFVLELDLDTCSLVHGQTPCTSTKSAGSECYNTFATCWDRPNYTKTVKTFKFCTIGMPIPHGEVIRPFIVDWDYSPAKLEEKKGLARNHRMTITLRDSTDTDAGDADPYFSNRATALSTWLRRLRARNPDFNGRFARVRQGYVMDPWDWNTFETRLFIIDSIDGPDEDGNMQITLKDSLKLADRVKVPEDTGARLLDDMLAYELEGYAQGGSANTIVLPASASNFDDVYNGMGIFIAVGTAAGQYRMISDYSGPTRTATVSVAWSGNFTPDQTSYAQIGRLSLTLFEGDGAKLNDPSVTGQLEAVRIGKELITYSTLSGDVISWPDLSWRGYLRTPIEKHKIGDTVQQCLTFVETRFYTVLKTLLNKAGITDSYIDTTGFQSEDDTWLGDNWKITWSYSKPEAIDNVLRELLYVSSCVMWWDIVAQKVKLKKLAAPFTAPATLTDDNGLIDGSIAVEFKDGERLTRAGIAYDIVNATEDARKIVNFLQLSVVTNLDEESANGQNAVKAEIAGAEFFSTPLNDRAALIAASNVLAHKLSAPIEIKFHCDPREQLNIGDFIDVETWSIVDKTGAKKPTRFLVIFARDEGSHIEVEGRSTIYGRRFGWIADNAAGDYPNDPDYCHISQNDGLMTTSGDEGYGICP